MRKKSLEIWWFDWEMDWRRLARWLLPSPGNVFFTLLVVAGLLWITNAGALPLRAPALVGDSTTTISYQGRLADSAGNPVTTSGVGMQFRLYNTDTGSSPLWEGSHTAVPVEDGLFHVLLGSTTPIPVSLLANNGTLWLGITVGSDSEMRPREQIVSVPYAMFASTVPDGTITTEKLADRAVTQAKLGADVSLEPPDGSITTVKLADGAVTSAKLEHSGPHIPITPGENGLVKIAVMRQDNTTNSYRNNQGILTGYGYVAGTGIPYVDDTVDIGVAFSDYPIVLVSFAGIQYNGGTSYPDTSTLGVFATVFDIDYSTFRVRVQQSAPGNTIGPTDIVFYTWIAIGTLE